VITKNEGVSSIVSKLCQGRLAVSTIEQNGAVGLFSAGYRVINEVRDEFQRRRDAVYESLNRIPGVLCKKPEGAFYIIAKLPVGDANEFLKWMLQEFDVDGETVMAAPGEGFYATEGLGKDEIRIAYVLDSDTLKRALQILEKGIIEYKRIRNKS
jgi:aspartate aminotransferase